MLFNLASVVDRQVETTARKRQVDIDNVRENAKQVTHDYPIEDQVYVKMTGIYRKIDHSKQGPYRITEVFTNSKFRVQWEQVNEQINVRGLKSHLNEYAYNRFP